MRLLRYWPLLANQLIFAGLVTVLIVVTVGKTDGRFAYPMDDSYIHMAMAKNASQHHVWGLTRYEFSSATSSPLWTLLLTGAYSALWVDERFPLVMDLALSVALIFLMYVWLSRALSKPALVFVVLLLAVLAGPLPALSLSGMEHILHAILALSFVWHAASALTENKRTDYLLVVALAPLMTATRYEGVFAVAVVCGGFLLARRWRQGLLLGATAAAPLVAYGLWSISHGWHFFPNPLLLKAGLPAELGRTMWSYLDGLPSIAARQLRENPLVVLLLAAGSLSLIPVIRGKRQWDRVFAASAICLGMIFLHLIFARFGWFYRYEAYLVIIGMVVFLPGLARPLLESRRRLAAAVLAVILIVFLIAFYGRALDSVALAPIASKNIYEQQYHMARFFREYYAGQPVAVNDVGAVCYLSDVRLVDLWGLGTVANGDLIRRRAFNTETIRRVSEKAGVKVAIVYETAFRVPEVGGLPVSWEKLGEWRIPDNKICGDTVAIFSVDKASTSELCRNLRAFSPRLPPNVIERGAYLSASLDCR